MQQLPMRDASGTLERCTSYLMTSNNFIAVSLSFDGLSMLPASTETDQNLNAPVTVNNAVFTAGVQLEIFIVTWVVFCLK